MCYPAPPSASDTACQRISLYTRLAPTLSPSRPIHVNSPLPTALHYRGIKAAFDLHTSEAARAALQEINCSQAAKLYPSTAKAEEEAEYLHYQTTSTTQQATGQKKTTNNLDFI